MCKSFLFLIVLFSMTKSFAHAEVHALEKRLYESNKELQALKDTKESEEALAKGAYSGYYPTLNVIGGLQRNKTDDRDERGPVGYLQGNFNLFRGFADETLVSKYSVRTKLRELDYEIARRRLKLSLIESLSEMTYLHKLKAILEDELSVTLTEKKMAARKVSAGLTGKVDDIEFELREDEIRIKQKQIDQQHAEAHHKLFEIFGEDITDSETKNINFHPLEVFAKFLTQAKMEKNPSVERSKLLGEVARLESRSVRAEFMPSVDLVYALGRLTPTNNTNLQFSESQVALLLTMPLFSGFSSHYKAKSASLAQSAAEKDKDQTELRVQAEFKNVSRKMGELLELAQINERKLINSKKYFELTMAEYRRGVKNSPDLVTATERWFETQKSQYEIMRDLEVYRVTLENLL
jgi:outer membrane protein